MKKNLFLWFVSLFCAFLSFHSMAANTLQGQLLMLKDDPFTFDSLVDEKDGYLFTNDKDGFITCYSIGDEFSLVKRWEYQFSADKMSYKGNYLLLINRSNSSNEVIDVSTGKKITGFIYRRPSEMGFAISLKLASYFSKVVILVTKHYQTPYTLRHTELTLQYLDMITQEELKNYTFTDITPPAILNGEEAVYKCSPEGIIKAVDINERDLWSTDLEFRDEYRVSMVTVGEDKLAIIVYTRDPTIYFLNRKTGTLLKQVGTMVSDEYVRGIDFDQDDDNVYIFDDHINVLSKSTLKRVTSQKFSNRNFVRIDSKYIYCASSNYCYIYVFDKATLTQVGFTKVDSSHAHPEQICLGPNNCIALYYRLSGGSIEDSGSCWANYHVRTYKFISQEQARL